MTQLLGEGGMGTVYLAEHPFLGRKAAIKILKPECASNADYVQRFLNEARAANAIHHSNIIDIIDVGILPEGVPYMMMEFLEGESLADRLRRVGRFPLGEATFVAVQIASALAAAHAASIIHRDLKPDNVFVIPDPQNPGQEHIKVLDFGIAKLRPEFAPSTPRTSAGALMGTPAYMSPEQCMGKTTEIDHRADIYALGIILFEMLCGRLPFQGQNFGEYFLQHITASPPQPRDLNPEIPVHIEAVILKALAKDAQDRIQTMNAFADLLAGKPLPATLVLHESPLDMGFARPVARPTVALPTDDEPLPRPSRGKHRSEPRLGRAHPSQPDANPLTTLSSTSGHMRMRTGNAAQGGHRTAVIVGVVVALCAVAAVGIITLSSRTTSQVKDESSSTRRAPEPLPAFQPPPTELPPLPARPEPHAKTHHETAEADPAIEEESGAIPPSGKPPSSTRERARTRPGSHGDAKPGRTGGRHEQGEGSTAAPASPAAIPIVIPSTAPPPVNPTPPAKTITREKF
jgi:serine/threonine protein kinase